MKRSIFFSAALLIPFFLNAQCVSGTTWISDVGANWNVNGNWSPATFPNATDATALFNNVHTGNPVTLNQAITIGNLCFNSGTFTIQSAAMSQTLTFSSSSTALLSVGATGSFTIDTFNGFSADTDLILASPLVFTSQGGSFSYIGNLAGSQSLTVDQGIFDYHFNVFSAHAPYTGEVIIGPSGIVNFTLENTFSGEDFVFGNLSGSGDLNIADSSFIFIGGANADAIFSGPISAGLMAGFSKNGTGTLTLSGPITTGAGGQVGVSDGILVLSGSNTIPGIFPGGSGILSVSSLSNLGNPTLINLVGGTLQVTGSTPFTYGGSYQINNNTPSLPTSTIDIASTTALTLSGVVANTGGGISTTWIKTGGGELILTNTNTYNSANIVNGGTFTVNGSITGPVTVNSSGILKGTGTLGAVTVNSGGTIAPGNSIGTLTVTGNLILNSSSITQIEISPSASSLILAEGSTTTLGGSVQVIVDPGSYAPTGSHLILSSTNAFTGAFDSTVLGGASDFTFFLSQGTHDVFLNWVFSSPSNPPIVPTGIIGSAAAFARYLNRNVPDSSATLELGRLSGTTLQKALESASPSRNAFAPFAVQNTMISFSDLVSGHLVDQRFYHAQKRYNPNVAVLMDDAASFTADSSGRMMYSRPCETQSFWIGVMGEYAHQSGLDENPAFNFWSGGSMIGWDFYGDQNLFGLAGGAAYTHLIQDENGGNAKINYYFASLYDTFYGPCDFPLYMELALWGVYNQIHNYRNISFPGFEGTASATFHSWELVPHLGFGYHASYCCFSLEPFAQFDLVVDWQEGFQEHGVGAFDMTHTSRNSQFLRSEGGLRLYKIKQTNWGTWMAMIKGSFVNKKAFGTGAISASIVGTSALFSVETFRNTENLGACGVEWLWRWGHRKPVTLSLAYNGEFGSQFWSQEGMIRLMKDF